mmetsp:Transcript_65101/g.183250  ORF Transcript_65101/g.183250 Transcript_65101/m.183250 type:complete len:211 (+) Transcript_65101:162-794(+)
MLSLHLWLAIRPIRGERGQPLRPTRGAASCLALHGVEQGHVGCSAAERDVPCWAPGQPDGRGASPRGDSRARARRRPRRPCPGLRARGLVRRAGLQPQDVPGVAQQGLAPRVRVGGAHYAAEARRRRRGRGRGLLRGRWGRRCVRGRAGGMHGQRGACPLRAPGIRPLQKPGAAASPQAAPRLGPLKRPHRGSHALERALPRMSGGRWRN